MATPTSTHLSSVVQNATQPAFTALTTAFVEPTNCLHVWAVPTFAFSNYLRENVSDPRQSSCRPKGWTTSSRIYPAICPEGWIYNSISQGPVWTVSDDSSTFISGTVATCCPSGYQIRSSSSASIVPLEWDFCYSSIATPGQTTLTATFTKNHSTTVFSDTGLIYRAAWTVGWDSNATSRFNIALPTLDKYENYVDTWKPGETAVQTSVPVSRHRHHGPKMTPALYFVAIGIPFLIIFAIVGCCIWRCCVKNRREAHAKQYMDGYVDNTPVADNLLHNVIQENIRLRETQSQNQSQNPQRNNNIQAVDMEDDVEQVPPPYKSRGGEGNEKGSAA